MTCEEFKNEIIDLFDTGHHHPLSSECAEHMAHCSECARYLKEMTDTASRIQIHLPAQKNRQTNTWHRRLMSAAAAIIIFLCGVMTGLSHLFSTSASADTSLKIQLSNSVLNLSNVGNYIIEYMVRSTPDEIFGHLDPTEPFVKMTLSAVNNSDTLFWRMEKENGQTAVFNGQWQYMWLSNGLQIQGDSQSGFIDEWLRPDNLLRQQENFIKRTSDRQTKTELTDSTLTVTSEGILNTFPNNNSHVRIESTFRNATGLLKSIRIWKEWNGQMILVLHTTQCLYNTRLEKADIIRIPERNTEWLDNQGPDIKKSQARKLKKETALHAAERVLDALISQHPETASEALYFYQSDLPALQENLKGCQASSFKVADTSGNYAGVTVFYQLTLPDGTILKRHINLRRDNKHQIWIVDGGL